ncbi:hypothetical protein ABFT80_05070 [Mesorhizobium sp. SB112]|uniref:hypothetical protein n=1 Tax=Mesorhizobium sp. SB112 TaxID=3151853 RepID=UPI003265E168
MTNTLDREVEILLGEKSSASIVDTLLGNFGLPAENARDDSWSRVVSGRLESMLASQMRQKIELASKRAA